MSRSSLHVLALLSVAGSAAGAVSFDPAITLVTPQRPGGAAIGDFNADGAADIAVATDTPDGITVHYSTGSGTFGNPTTVFTGAGTGPESLVAADFDGDGDDDLAVVLSNINRVAIYLNAGGVLTPAGSYGVGQEARALRAHDLDGDGDADLMTANRDSNNVSILWNDAVGFSVASLPAGTEPRGVAAGDFDGDGDSDLVVTNHRDRTVGVYTNIGARSFLSPVLYAVGGLVRPEGVDTADMDGDGDVDVVVANSDDFASFVGVFENTGATFVGPINHAVGGLEPSGLRVADLDGDGDADVVTNNEDAASVSVLENTGTGVLTLSMTLATGANPEDVVLGDLTGSGLPSLVVPNRDSGTTSVFLNGGSSEPCGADFNGDGVRDTNDILAYIVAFNGGAASAEMNGDGLLNTRDFLAFLNLWVVGC